MKSIFLNLGVFSGSDIIHACMQALTLANKVYTPVRFEFNEVIVTIHPGDEAETIIESFMKFVNFFLK